jgi:hypothetical protein
MLSSVAAQRGVDFQARREVAAYFPSRLATW